MSERNRQGWPGKRIPLHARFYFFGAFILIAGLISAIFIFVSASYNEELDHVWTNRKSYEFQLERIGGKSAILGVELTQWFSSLWHGKNLAYTLAFLTILAAIACFWLGRHFHGQSENRNG